MDIYEDFIDLNQLKYPLHNLLLAKISQSLENHEFYTRLVDSSLYDFITLMSIKFSSLFQQSKQQVLECIEDFKHRTDKMSIGNKYLIIGLIKELSSKCYTLINLNLSETIINLADADSGESFAKYIIEKHELFNLIATHTGALTSQRME